LLYTNKKKTCLQQNNIGSSCNDFYPNIQNVDIPFGSNYYVMCNGTKCMGNSTMSVCSTYRGLTAGSTCNFEEQCRFGLYCDPIQNICKSISPKIIICPGSSRNCSSINEKCVCEGSESGGEHLITNSESGTCQTVIENNCGIINNGTGLNSFRNSYSDCLIANNCPIEKNFDSSWLSNLFEKSSCAGKFCSSIAKSYLCCAYQNYNYNQFSIAYGVYAILHCKYVNVPSIVGVSILGLFFIFLFVALTVYAILSQLKIKRTINLQGKQ